MEDNQQAYDRGTSIFSPDGRLYQVEYAREAVRRGTASVGVRTADGVVLVADRRVRSPLVEEESIEKLHTVDDHVAVASAGHVADARQLVDFARKQAQTNYLRYDEPIGVEALTKEVTDYIQRYTQSGRARPFGVALAVAGVDPDGTPRLFETDPSGTPYGWQATAIGSDRDAIMGHLEDEYREDVDLGGGIALALEAFAAAGEEFDASNVEVSTVDVGTGTVQSLDREAIADHADELGLDGGRGE